MTTNNFYKSWPEFSYAEFQPTAHLLHMGIQAIGKLKLTEPFEPHWANVALWLTTTGLTTGLIPFGLGFFSVDWDCIHHQIICTTSWGRREHFLIRSMSVAEFTHTLFKTLHNIGIDLAINQKPQEISNPIPFNEDTATCPYEGELVNTWWQIMLSTHKVLERYHARFTGRSPPIGLMWGTLDLRDARYKGIHVPTTGENAGFIRRNAMDDAQVEAGWWAGNELYSRPAFFSFIYPQPKDIEKAKIEPKAARWDTSLKEFILDYDDLRKSPNPDKDLLAFFESAYQAGAERAGWERDLISKGVPV